MTRPRILLVDDEPHVTRNLAIGLRRKPWEVETAASGYEGLERMREEPFDVVVSDERMPGMAGSEFLTRVAAEFPDTVRIILSGQASLDATIRAINEAGIFRFLTKPCTPEDWIACLEAAIEAGRAARRAATRARRGLDDVPSAEVFGDAIGRLWMAFQPILRSEDFSVYGWETLVRCDHVEVPHPGVLFDTAEALDRVLEVEEVIRELVARSAREVPEGCRLFVNLHPASLDDPAWFAEDNPLFASASKITLEITERASLEGIPDLRSRIDALRDIGFRIAVDDLGSGYAGLNTFALLQPDVVKLDMELIRGVDTSTTNAKVVESMTRLGGELGFEIVAEGIETVAELETLRGLGCGLLQGFLLARPAKGLDRPVWPRGDG